MSIPTPNHEPFMFVEPSTEPLSALHPEGVYDDTLGLDAVAAYSFASRMLLLRYDTAVQETTVMSPIDGLAPERQNLIVTLPQTQPNMTVATADQAAALGFAHDDEYYKNVAAEEKQKATLKLAEVRQRISDLPAQQAGKIDTYLSRTAPADLKLLATNSLAIVPYGHEHIESKWRQWMITANDDDLLKFLRWHVDMLAEQQSSPRVRESEKQLKAMYKNNVARGLRDDWLGTRAQTALDETDAVPIVLGDAFSTVVQGYGGYLDQSRTVVIRAGEGPSLAARQANAAHHIDTNGQHELNHRFFEFDDLWRDEAYAEHTDLVMRHGGLEIIDPYYRVQEGIDSRIYMPYRRLEAFLLQSGRLDIPVAIGTKAYSGGADDLMMYKDALASSWNDSRAYEKVNQAVRRHYGELVGNGVPGQTAYVKAVECTLSELMANADHFMQSALE